MDCDRLFLNPQKYRDDILRALRFDPQGWDGQSYVVVYPTKFCPVGCTHCYFASPKPSHKTPDTVLDRADATRISRVLDDANTAFLQITGAGEPLLELDTVLDLVRRSRAARIDIQTSAATLSSPSRAAQIIESLFAAFCSSGNGGRLTFRVSIDEFHLEQAGDKSIRNTIAVFRGNHARLAAGRFHLKLHSIIGDDSIPQLLAQFSNEICAIEHETENEYGRAFAQPLPSKVVFRDGTVIHMDYSLRMFADARPDMSRSAEISRAVAAYDALRLPNPALYRDPAGRQGLCFVIHEDGSLELWNTAIGDNVLNVRTHGFAEFKSAVFSDVIQVATLEQSALYIESLLDEVNPLAIRRAKAIGSAAHFHVNAFTEAKDRLYVSLRVIQDYLIRGRIVAMQLLSLDPLIQSAIRLSHAELRSLYAASDRDIVDQHLDDAAVTATKLVHLYRSLELGHYVTTPATMIRKVRASLTLPETEKSRFLAAVL